MTAPRVLQLLGPSTGGIRRHVAYLTGHLRSAGWEVTIAGPEGVLDDLDHVVPIPDGLDPRGVERARRALRPLLGGVDVVHAHGLKAGWIAALASPRRNRRFRPSVKTPVTERRSFRSRGGGRTPLVLSVHNLVLDDVAGRSAPILRRIEGRLPAAMDATIAISGEVGRRFDGHRGAERIRVVPPAGPPPEPKRSSHEVRADLGIAPDDDLVVTAARLTHQKGLGDLVAAAEVVAARRPKLRWFVFGDGPLRAELEAEIAARGLTSFVHLPGARPSVDDEFAAADVVAVTSRWESGPLVVLEALALQRPVVSTRVGLVPDVMDDRSGRIVDVGDVPALADAVIEMLSDPPASPGGMSGSFARFQPPALAAAVEAVYREVWTAP